MEIKVFCCHCREEFKIEINFGQIFEKIMGQEVILGPENWSHYTPCSKCGFNTLTLIESKIKEA